MAMMKRLLEAYVVAVHPEDEEAQDKLMLDICEGRVEISPETMSRKVLEGMNYPKITVNGVELTQGQAMTVHVALQSYAMDMGKKGKLGDDEHGEFMRKAYLERIKEINKLYMGS